MPTTCPACGVPIAPGTQNCANCGSSVHPTGSYPVVAAPAQRRSRARSIAVALGLAVLLVAVGGWVATALSDEDDADSAQSDAETAAVLDDLEQRHDDAPSTTATAEPAADGSASAATTLLTCDELSDSGVDAEQAAEYWEAHGRPAALDTDGDGVPCDEGTDATAPSDDIVGP